MALQELSPQPRITGPEVLGAAISNASERYANTRRQDDLLARARSNQLADVASERAYEQERYQRARTDQLTDEQRRQMRAIASALVNERLLSPEQMDDPVAVGAAYQEAVRRGLDKVYQELTSTPGTDGKPLLSVSDFDKPEKINAAKQALNEIKAKQTGMALSLPTLQQEDFTRLRQEEQQIQGEIKVLSDALQRTADYVPTEAEVSNAALALAQALKKPGEAPSAAEINSQRATALQKLREIGMQNQYLDRQTKAVQLDALTSRLNAIKANTQAYIQRGIGPRVLTETPQPTAPVTTPVAPAGPAPMQSFQQMLDAELAKRAPATPAATPVEAPMGSGSVAIGPGAAGQLLTPIVDALGRMAQRRPIQFGTETNRATPITLAPEPVVSPNQFVSSSDIFQPYAGGPATVGRPITSAPSLFPTPQNWWSGGR